MSEISLRGATKKTPSEPALLVSWYRDLADGVGAAASLTPELRSALVLATADAARELGAVIRAEVDRAREAEERERKAHAAKVARNQRRILMRQLERFVARIGQLVPRGQLDQMTPTQLADVMSARWSEFVPLLAAGPDDLAAWIQARLGAPAARDFAQLARSTQSDGDSILANFVVEFGSPHAQVFCGVTMTRSSISDAASVEPVLASEPYVQFSAALYKSRLMDSFARRDSDLANVAVAWRESLERWIALSGESSPSPEVIASLLAVAVVPDFAKVIAEEARDAVSRARGAAVPAWPTIGESPVIDLISAASAREWESRRLGGIRGLLERHGLLASGKPVPQLPALATTFGKSWELALDLVRAPDRDVLLEYASSEGVELPEGPIVRDTAAWDKYLAEVLVALDPRGRPRFMDQSISRHKLLDFLGTGSVFVEFKTLPSRILEKGLRAKWAEKYEERTARLLESGVLTIYSVLPGQTELRMIDELWHAHAKDLPSFFKPGRQFWVAILLRCICRPGLVDELGELAVVRRQDRAAARRKWYRRFHPGRSLAEDLAIVTCHDRALSPRGWAGSIAWIVVAFLVVWLVFFVASWVIGAIVVLFDLHRLQTVVNVAGLVGLGAGLLVAIPIFLGERGEHRAENWALRE